ncbi:MAG: sugar transferase, partial [Lachnospiraceae bacterium]|nr:sugar transferase [Lachnospiraceae bacterium]
MAMIKDNQRVLNRLLVIIDALILGGSLILSYIIKFYILLPGPGVGVLPLSEYIRLLTGIIPGYLLLYYIFDTYSPKRTSHLRMEVYSILKANVAGILSLIFILYIVIKEINYSRSVIAFFFVTNVFFSSAFRLFLRVILRNFRKKGYNLKHILLVGYSRAAEEYIKRIKDNPSWGYVVCGILDDHIPAGTEYRGVKVLGSTGNLEIILPENKMDEIAITLALADYDILEKIVDICEKFGVHTKFIPDYNSVIPTKPYTEDLMGLPVINIRHVPLTNTGNILIKRVVDIFGALVGIILTSPIMLVCAALIKFTSPGPVIFMQKRIGLHNKPFNIYKFRSMRVQTEETEKKGWTTKDDPRVTGVGRFMR